jgi:hypothetical protein
VETVCRQVTPVKHLADSFSLRTLTELAAVTTQSSRSQRYTRSWLSTPPSIEVESREPEITAGPARLKEAFAIHMAKPKTGLPLLRRSRQDEYRPDS